MDVEVERVREPSVAEKTYAAFTPNVSPPGIRGRPCDRRNIDKKTGATRAPVQHQMLGDQFSGTFLPSLYWYRVIAGFFNSPSASNPIFAVTPWKSVLNNCGP